MNRANIKHIIIILLIFISVQPIYSFNYHSDSINSKVKTLRGIPNKFLQSLLSKNNQQFWINGVFNPYLIYRRLDTKYDDVSSKEQLSFAPYPNFLSPVVNTLQPTLSLAFGGSIGNNLNFNIDYAYYYMYDSDKKSKNTFNGQNNLVFTTEFKNRLGLFKFYSGGGVIPIHFSALTLSNKYIREPLFDRVPWEYHNNSEQKYAAHFQQSISQASIFTNTGSQGFYLTGTDLPFGFSGKAFYGRTQLNLFPDALERHLPSEIGALQLTKALTDSIKTGLVLYNNNAWADTRKVLHDVRQIISFENSFRTGKLNIASEFGVARLQNPSIGQSHDFGFLLRIKSKTNSWPVALQFFAIGKNYVCLENEAFNSNPIYRQGGFSGDKAYDNFLFQSYVNPVGTIANNRLGIDVQTEYKTSNFSFAIGHQASRELDNFGDEITFPHLVNAYSRSRFRPWQQYTGPYGRIGNRFRMSIERIKLTKDVVKTRYVNSTFLDLKLKIPMQKRFMYLCSYSVYGAIGTQAFETYFNLQKGFLQTTYQEFELIVPVLKSVNLVGYVGWELNQASRMTQLDSTTLKPLNQAGKGLGLGIDFDIMDNFGFYLRHRWMAHKDRSFLKDQFSGQESVVELKISF